MIPSISQTAVIHRSHSSLEAATQKPYNSHTAALKQQHNRYSSQNNVVQGLWDRPGIRWHYSTTRPGKEAGYLRWLGRAAEVEVWVEQAADTYKVVNREGVHKLEQAEGNLLLALQTDLWDRQLAPTSTLHPFLLLSMRFQHGECVRTLTRR